MGRPNSKVLNQLSPVLHIQISTSFHKCFQGVKALVALLGLRCLQQALARHSYLTTERSSDRGTDFQNFDKGFAKSANQHCDNNFVVRTKVRARFYRCVKAPDEMIVSLVRSRVFLFD